MSEKKFSKQEALEYGWEKYKNNFVFLVLLVLVWIGIISIPGNILSTLVASTAKTGGKTQMSGLAPLVGVFTLIAISWTIIAAPGAYRILMKIADGGQAQLSEIITDGKTITNFFIASLFVGIAVAIGIMLLVVPGVYLGIRLQFYGFLILDMELGPMEAIKKSWELTSDSTVDLFLLGLIVVGLSFLAGIVMSVVLGIPLGIIAGILGTFLPAQKTLLSAIVSGVSGALSSILAPLFAFAQIHVYRKLLAAG